MRDTPAGNADVRLQRLAEVAVRIGLNVAPGQQLVISAPVEALPLVRCIADQAYMAGASLVTPLLTDDEVSLSRFRHGHEASFDEAGGWLFDGMAQAYRGGAARLGITGDDPALFAGQDPARLSRVARARSVASKNAMDLIVASHINWSIVAYPTRAWAARVFPLLSVDGAVDKLWDAIFAASRITGADPVASWKAHNASLRARCARLDARRYSSLHFRGPGTDLRVGLADGHLWAGGSSVARNGVECNPNIPTEEVFTTPHSRKVDGTVRSTKPLSLSGSMVEDIEVRFQDGLAIEARARTGQANLDSLLGSDAGARRLGEVALVPHSSPISQGGLLFLNTLFDENAASHIALGQSYLECVSAGEDATPEELAARGANSSVVHVDWMIGSGQMDVDGILPDGTAEPVMRQGEWA